MGKGADALGQGPGREEGYDAVAGLVVAGIYAVAKAAAEGELAPRALAGLGIDEGAISDEFLWWARTNSGLATPSLKLEGAKHTLLLDGR